MIAVAPAAPDDVAVVEGGSSGLVEVDDIQLDLDSTQPGDPANEDTATSATSAQDDEEPMDLVQDLDVLADVTPVDEADLEGIEIEANGDPAEAPELMTGAESLFDHGADLSRYHHDDE